MGLTAGFYGAPDEMPWFQDGIEAGVTYANRGAGRDHGRLARLPALRRMERAPAHPARRSPPRYYLPLYMREQSRTVVE